GKPFASIDFNFWGTTFAADGHTFYATLGTGGTTYLVQGDLAAKTLKTIHEGVECPSLSPDGTRIAYKQRTGVATWRIAVLDLATMRETPITSETRNVDDQIEWLDAHHVLYALSAYDASATGGYRLDTWQVDVDAPNGGGAPQIFLHNAFSPA